MICRGAFTVLVTAMCLWAGNPVAARLAKAARRAQDHGEVVRAYLLFAEAAARDPQTPAYAVSRDAMKPLADLMTKSNIESGTHKDIEDDIRSAEHPIPAGEGLPAAADADIARGDELASLPHLKIGPGTRDFNLRGDDKSLFTMVAHAYGVEPVFDPEFDSKPGLRFAVTQADFRAALDALTHSTQTFVFPIDEHHLFISRDTEMKRNEFEPQITLTVSLPNAIDGRDVVEAANAVRGTVGLHGTISWNGAGRQVVIRNHVTQARVERALLESLLLERPQVSFEVEFLTFDEDARYKYGISWQNTFQVLELGLLKEVKAQSFPALVNSVALLPFGGGATTFGVGLADAQLFATYTHSVGREIFRSNVTVSDGQTASLHVGDKYPIPTALYTGASQNSGGAYNPIGQVTQEDLGLTLKIQPRIHADSAIGMQLEVEFKTLGATALNTVPIVNQRSFKGDVTLGENEWAIVGGMDEEDHTLARSTFPLLGDVRWLDQVFTQTTREHRISNTLVVIKPTITRLPMSETMSPQFLLGSHNGVRVLF